MYPIPKPGFLLHRTSKIKFTKLYAKEQPKPFTILTVNNPIFPGLAAKLCHVTNSALLQD